MNIFTFASGSVAASYRTIFVSNVAASSAYWKAFTIGTAGSPANSEWAAIGYGAGAFVATHNNFNTPQAKISYDNGATWTNTQSNPNLGQDRYPAVIYTETVIGSPPVPTWIALSYGFSNTIGFSGAGQGASWSKDYPNGGYFTAIAAGSDRAVIFGDGVSNSRYINYRGAYDMSWSTRDLGAGQKKFVAAASNGLSAFVGIASDNDKAYYSIDNANTWGTGMLPASSKWQGIAYGDGCYMAVASGISTGVISLDLGTTWTAITLSGTPRAWRDVAFGNGMFLVVGEPDACIYTADRGQSWKSLTFPLSNFNPRKVTFGTNTFVAIASGIKVCTLQNLQPNNLN